MLCSGSGRALGFAIHDLGRTDGFRISVLAYAASESEALNILKDCLECGVLGFGV